MNKKIKTLTPYISFFLFIFDFMSYTIKEYIESKADLYDKICAIEALINSMIASMADAIDVSGTASYSMDDGQMKVTTQYRSVTDINMGILQLEKMKQMYVNRYNGRVTILRGRKNY